MGNKGSKTLPPGVKYDSNEYWEFEMNKLLSPVESMEDFCERFHGLFFFFSLFFPSFFKIGFV